MTSIPAVPAAGSPLDEKAAAADIRRFVSALRRPGEVIELRALDVPPAYGRKGETHSGYFRVPDDLGRLVEAAIDLTRGGAAGVYVTLNPVLPALYARAPGLVVCNPKHTTSDKEIVRRAWLPVDLDPVRPAGISADADEKFEAWRLVAAVKAYMAEKKFTPPVVCDSGNGYHGLFPIDLPTEDEGRVKSVLEALAKRYTGPRVAIDTSMFNPARIVKLPGTMARKGFSVADRPHRQARVLEVPA